MRVSGNTAILSTLNPEWTFPGLKPSGETITYKSWKWDATWSHTERLWVKRAYRPGFCFYWGGESGFRDSQAHFVLVNLKHQRGNLKCRKRKTSGSDGQLWKSTKIFKAKETHAGRVGLALYLAKAGNMFIEDSCLWSGCLHNLSLNQALGLQKRKNNSGQSLHYIYVNINKYYVVYSKSSVCEREKQAKAGRTNFWVT